MLPRVASSSPANCTKFVVACGISSAASGAFSSLTRANRCREAMENASNENGNAPSISCASDPAFTLLAEEVRHARYLTLYNRRVQFPAPADGQPGPVHEFDIVGHPKANFHFSVTFPFHSAPSQRWRDGAVTLVREYCQGINAMAYCLPTGAFDPRRHADYEACARAELSEEAFLKGGELRRLLADGPGVPEVKWCANRFTPFIALDPETDEHPGERDGEEFIQVVKVSVPELRAIMRSGGMMLPSVTTCWWALEFLAAREGDVL